MTPKAEKQLKFMFSCLFEGTTDPKVIITTAANGCKAASENMDSISPCRFMEQNPKSGSVFADAVQKGWLIAWLMNDQPRGYLGPVPMSDGGRVQIRTRESAKVALAGGWR